MGGKIKSSNSPADAITVFLEKVLIAVGKPFFFTIFALLFVITQALLFPGLLLKKLFVFSDQKLKRVFLFPRKIKRIKKTRKKVSINELTILLNKYIWNIEVFFLALKKFPSKITPSLSFGIRLPKLHISFIKFIGILGVAVFVVSFISGILFWNYILKDLPSPRELSERKLSVSTKIYDRRKELLYTIFRDQKRTPVKLDQIPIEVRLATVAAEDKDFYTHPGFSVRGILRAIFKDLREGRITGGSTITQQLVKNALLSPEKTIVRKIKEIVLSIQVEKYYSKDQILEMYLNEVPYGGTAYGIEEAANTLFDKKVGEINLSEASFLAGLPQSPSKYSPFGGGLDSAQERQREILGRMEALGFITKDQRIEAETKDLTFAKSKVLIKAPHYVFYVRDLLEEEYGKEMVEKGGLEVITTLDYEVQKAVEGIVHSELEKLKDLNVGNASAVVMDPKTGEVLAMVGSKDFFDIENGGNVNVATRPRQPGSSIKVVNYAFAIANGLTPATIVPDTPETFKVEGQPPYTPKNYEGEFRGNLTLRSALAESRNIPAVRILASYGVQNMIDLGRKMGITTWTDPDNYGLSLTLGGGEVKLIDLTRVFATLANYGKRPELTSILEVKNYENTILADFNCQENETETAGIFKEVSATESASNLSFENSDCTGEQVLDPRVAFIITDILKDNTARAPSFGTSSLLNIKNHPEVAVKTGTSNDLRDNLAIGYTKDYVVAVWIGNNDNSEMSRIASGVTGATPIFNKIMSALLANKPKEDWQVPQGLVQVAICPLTGTLACDGCPNKMEWFLEENKPNRACDPEWFDQENDEKKEENTNEDKSKRRNRRQDFERLLEEQMRRLRDTLNINE